MRINISLKLFLGFLVVILMNSFYVVVILKLTDLNGLASIVKRQNVLKNYLLQISNLHGRQNRSRAVYDAIQSNQSLDNFKEASAAIDGLVDSINNQIHHIRRLDSAVSTPESALDNARALTELSSMITDKIVRHLQYYNKEFISLVVNRDKLQKGEFAKRKSAIDSADRRLVAAMKSVDSILDEQSSTRLRIIEERINNVVQMALVILISMTVFALGFGLIFSRATTNSLRKLKESAKYIGKGNFNFSPSGYPKDEIGDLALAFFEMAMDLKNTQEELVKSKRLAAIGEVVASVNHEINNPLMIISGNAQFLEMSMANYPDEMKERVKTILDETERISAVTRKLREIKNPVVEDYTASGEQMINLDKSST